MLQKQVRVSYAPLKPRSLPRFFFILSILNLVYVESNPALITVIFAIHLSVEVYGWKPTTALTTIVFTVHLSVEVYGWKPTTAPCSCHHHNAFAWTSACVESPPTPNSFFRTLPQNEGGCLMQCRWVPVYGYRTKGLRRGDPNQVSWKMLSERKRHLTKVE